MVMELNEKLISFDIPAVEHSHLNPYLPFFLPPSWAQVGGYDLGESSTVVIRKIALLHLQLGKEIRPSVTIIISSSSVPTGVAPGPHMVPMT